MFDVKTNEGVVTGRVDGAHLDAAVVGSIAGIEVSLERMHAFDAPKGERARPLTLSLDMTPEVMSQLLYVLADRLKLPAFNAREWETIEGVLLLSDSLPARDLGLRLAAARVTS